jgi:hypothetical protein
MPYIDQFDRADPLTLNAIGIFKMWPRQAAFEAQALLADGRTTQDLKAIATDVEALICNQVGALLRLPRSERQATLEGNPKEWIWSTDLDHRNPAELLRERHGDTNLFEAAIEHGQGRLPTSIEFSDWEGYAVIALWKLVEFKDALTAPRRRLILAHLPPSDRPMSDAEALSRLMSMGVAVPREEFLEAQVLAAPLVVEAVRACALGTEARLRAAQMAVLKTRAQRERALAIERVEMRRRQEVSKRARESADKGHEHLARHQERAFQLANSKWFPSLAAAARYAAARISKSDGREGGGTEPESDEDCYTERTVGDWLKAKGWKRQPKPPGSGSSRGRKA